MHPKSAAMRRRNFLLLCSGALTCLFNPKVVFAAWSAKHFAPGDFTERFEQVFANLPITDSPDIVINLPDSAENGAVVPITISSDLANIQHLYIWVEKNPTPLAAEFELDASLAVFMTARIKMAESCHVIVIAQQGERLLRNQQWVNVMLGGCGTG